MKVIESAAMRYSPRSAGITWQCPISRLTGDPVPGLHMDDFRVYQDLRDVRVRVWRETLLQERCIVVLKQALAVYIVQHPDAAGTVFHRQHKFVLGQRKFDEVNLIWDHQARILECSHTEGLSNWLSVSWIEADSPHIE